MTSPTVSRSPSWTMPKCPVPDSINPSHNGGAQAKNGPLYRPITACDYPYACTACLETLGIEQGPQVFKPVTTPAVIVERLPTVEQSLPAGWPTALKEHVLATMDKKPAVPAKQALVPAKPKPPSQTKPRPISQTNAPRSVSQSSKPDPEAPSIHRDHPIRMGTKPASKSHEVRKPAVRSNGDLTVAVREPKNTSRFTPTAPSFVPEGAVSAPRNASPHTFGSSAVSPNRPKVPPVTVRQSDLKKAVVNAPRPVLARQVPAAPTVQGQQSQPRRRVARLGR